MLFTSAPPWLNVVTCYLVISLYLKRHIGPIFKRWYAHLSFIWIIIRRMLRWDMGFSWMKTLRAFSSCLKYFWKLWILCNQKLWWRTKHFLWQMLLKRSSPLQSIGCVLGTSWRIQKRTLFILEFWEDLLMLDYKRTRTQEGGELCLPTFSFVSEHSWELFGEVFGVRQNKTKCRNMKVDTIFLYGKPPLAQLRCKNHDLPQ